jgi:hypothetical protein
MAKDIADFGNTRDELSNLIYAGNFKVTTKSYNVATRTAEPRRVKTVHNSHSSKASNSVLLTSSCAVRGSEVLPWP